MDEEKKIEVGTDENDEIDHKEKENSKKIARAKANLIHLLENNTLNTFISRVAYILNHYPETRNSDRRLALVYWETFQNDIYNGGKLSPEQYCDLEPQTSITRARAKIQNEFKLFSAEEKIQKWRRKKEADTKEQQLAIVPPKPITTVNCDEGGKNETYTLVGSVWSLDVKRHGQLREHIIAWRAEKNLKVKDEFHFVDIKGHQVELFKEYIDLIAKQSDSISFKAVAVRGETTKKKIDEIVTDLYKILLIHGLRHELDSGRSNLPRTLNVYKDREDGKDTLLLETQKLHLQESIKVHFENHAELALFEPVESYVSHFIQIADLFTGCVGRKLNFPVSNNNKDIVANYFFDKFEIDKETFNSANSDFVSIELLTP
jgi:hypothetical protein